MRICKQYNHYLDMVQQMDLRNVLYLLVMMMETQFDSAAHLCSEQHFEVQMAMVAGSLEPMLLCPNPEKSLSRHYLDDSKVNGPGLDTCQLLLEPQFVVFLHKNP